MRLIPICLGIKSVDLEVEGCQAGYLRREKRSTRDGFRAESFLMLPVPYFCNHLEV
jgi:hypothetical protein